LPTLVYDIDAPRTQNVRKWYVVREFMCGFGCFLCFYVGVIDFIWPVLLEKRTGILWTLWKLLRLCVPTIIVWLIAFYAIFHNFLNGLAELTGWADRQFYLDWWNAESMDVFWKKWNMPTHEWLTRHIYWSSRRRVVGHVRSPEWVATWATFFASAIMHEFVLSLMFRVVKPLFFTFLLLQIPAISVSKLLVRKVCIRLTFPLPFFFSVAKLLSLTCYIIQYNHNKLPSESAKRWGNCFVWALLVFGYPHLDLCYFETWLQSNGTQAVVCLPQN